MSPSLDENQHPHKGAKPQQRGRRWRRGRDERPARHGADTEPPEHSTFPQPDAPTEAIPEPKAPARPRPAAHRNPDTAPDRCALNIIGISTLSVRDKWPAARLEESLHEQLDLLHGLAEQERAAALKLLGRGGEAARAAGRVAEVIEAAVKVETFTGVPTSLDPESLGAGLTALTANAHRPLDATMQFPKPLYVDGMADPRETPPAPVEVTQVLATAHPWDALGGGAAHATGTPLTPAVVQPAIPHGDAPEADTALPHREPCVMPAPLGPDGGPRHGRKIDPRVVELAPGDWVFRGGLGADAAVYRQVADVVCDEDGTHIGYRGGERQDVAAGRTVRVLSSDEAALLLAQHREQLAESRGNAEVSR